MDRTMLVSPPKHRRRDDGFSLLEILIALAILALAVGLVGAGFVRSSSAMRFDEGVRALASDLAATQTRAMRTGRDAALVIDVDRVSYMSIDGEARSLAPATRLRVTSAAEVASAGGLPSFVFSADGGASGGSIELDMPGRKAAVLVDWLTGQVRIEEQDADALQ